MVGEYDLPEDTSIMDTLTDDDATENDATASETKGSTPVTPTATAVLVASGTPKKASKKEKKEAKAGKEKKSKKSKKGKKDQETDHADADGELMSPRSKSKGRLRRFTITKRKETGASPRPDALTPTASEREAKDDDFNLGREDPDLNLPPPQMAAEEREKLPLRQITAMAESNRGGAIAIVYAEGAVWTAYSKGDIVTTDLFLSGAKVCLCAEKKKKKRKERKKYVRVNMHLIGVVQVNFQFKYYYKLDCYKSRILLLSQLC